MADDIDIEEHDVLDSLRRRQLAGVVVKEEPVDQEYTESHFGLDSGFEPNWDWESHGIDPSQIKVEKPDETDFQFGKIILGSKPPVPRQEPTEEKVTDQGDEEEKDRQENYNYNMSLVLEDWGAILQASNCYCDECQILFATVNALDAHKMIAHSFLVETYKEPSPERNRAIKSTAKPNDVGVTCEICKYTFKGEKVARFNLLRHYRNVHQIDPLTINSENELRNWKVCNHCNVYFPSDTALVKHLYELLPLNDNKANKDDKPSPVKVQSVVKVPNDNVIVTSKPIKTYERQPVKPNPVIVPTVSKKPIPVPVPTITKKLTPVLDPTGSKRPNLVPVPIVSKKPNPVPVPIVSKKSNPVPVPVVTKRQNPVPVPVVTKRPNPVVVPTVSNVEAKPKPKPAIVKDVKPVQPITPKQANSLILGSKVNGVRVDDQNENIGIEKIQRNCEVCGIEYSRRYYHKHMRKFHPEVLQKKLNRLKKMAPLLPLEANPLVRYKCRICNVILNGFSRARKHRAEKHPEMKGRSLLKKMVATNKSQKVKTKPTPVENEVQLEDKSDLIVSKSTLFKCNRCSVHFLTCYGACAHSRVCETSSNIRDWSCPQCQRVFKSVDKKAHEFQHNTVGNKFKVYVVYLEMVVRILCECPYCYVCFEEYKFWRHINFGCERETESFHCGECRLLIDSSSKESHESKHVQGDFTKEDFIKIDFISSMKEQEAKAEPKKVIVEPKKVVPVPSLKRKMASPDVEPKKRKEYIRNLRDEKNIIYCPTCKIYLTVKARQHMTGKCRNMKSYKHHSSCKVCGISFTAKTAGPHLRLHRKYPNLTLSDLTFTRITDDKRMKPIPEYYPCKSCHINFLIKTSRRTHICGQTKSCKCQVCDKKIPKIALKMHMRFHNYVLPGRVKPATPKTPQSDAKTSSLHMSRSEVKSPTKQFKRNEPRQTMKETELPELLMKYQSLTTFWNILYVCETCDTFTDSYDKVVEHCQNHFTNMESYGVVIMKCQICNMKFDRECYRRHLELHGGSNDISRKSFTVLRYAHAKLFSTEWLSFMVLPEDQKTQILTRSIYGEAKCVRMYLEQQGPPEYTLYRCKQCLKCVTPDAIIHHINLRNCLKANNVICRKCPLTFVNNAARDRHKKIHDATDLEADSFRIIAFNDLADAELNKKILSEYDTGEVIETVAERKSPDFFSKYPNNVKTIKGKKFYMFYKCADCEVCTLDENSSGDHVCCALKEICPKCGLTFASEYLDVHDKLHDEIDFSEKNVFTRTFFTEIVPMDEDVDVTNTDNVASDNLTVEKNVKQNDNKKDEAKLYKCHCGLHFISLKTIEKHYQEKNCGSVVREKCSQCNLVFDPNEVVNHLCKHHAQTRYKSFDIITPNKKTVYKCDKCNDLFYDKRIGNAHKEKCDGVSNGTKCEQCGLTFDAFSIQMHSEDHDASSKLKRDCYIVMNINDDGRRVDNNVLYKCKKCNVHYIEIKSARNHIQKGIHQSHQNHLAKKCDECGLRFPNKTLPRHVELHHNMLKIDRFRIKCIPVGITNNPPENSESTGVKVNKKSTMKEPPLEKETDEPLALKIVKEGEVNKIFKCKKCKLHFTDENTLVSHTRDRCSKELVEECEFCSMKFASKNIKEHEKQHDGEGTINMDITEDVDITVEDVEENDDKIEIVAEADQHQDKFKDTDTIIYRCNKKCDLHFNHKDTALRHLCNKNKLPLTKCEVCDRLFTGHSLKRHAGLHDKFNLKKEDFIVINVPDSGGVEREPVGLTDEHSQTSTNDTVESLDSSLEAETDNIPPNIKLYKCGDCKVYFISQKTCYKHILNHTPLNLKNYIECKLCGFQFTIMALQIHIKKHHAGEFKLEEVLVQEYQPSVLKNNLPNVETYFAIDKEQAGLVSTSSDVNNDVPTALDTSKEIENEYSESMEEITVDSTEITSNCNELIEKVDSSDKT